MKNNTILDAALTQWFSEVELLFDGISEEPGYFRYNPLSMVKVAEWCQRLQELDKKNQVLNGGKSRYSVFDLETTGLHTIEEFATGAGGITDIAASLIVGGEYLGNEVAEDGTQDFSENPYEFNSLTNPGIEIPDVVINLTGITNEMVSEARPQRDVLENFRQFSNGAILVGHNIGDDQFNARGFDVARVYGPIAETTFGDSKDELLANSIDTLPLFKNWIAGTSHKNEDLGRWLGVKLVGAHRAMPDVRVNAISFNKMLPVLLSAPTEKLIALANKQMEHGHHIVTHVQPGGFVDDNDKLHQWIEFGVKLDRTALDLPGRKKTLIVKYDAKSDKFLYQETEFKSGILSEDEMAVAIPAEALKRQACILKQERDFDKVVESCSHLSF